jgi:DNA-binding transcriptional MerR regulator
MLSVRTEDLLTAGELANRLKVQPSTVLNWARRGVIPKKRLSHKVHRFSLRDVVNALEQRNGRGDGK